MAALSECPIRKHLRSFPYIFLAFVSMNSHLIFNIPTRS